MAIKITALPESTSPSDEDILLIVDIASGSSKKIKRSNLFKNPPFTPGSIDMQAIANPYVFSARNSLGLTLAGSTRSTITGYDMEFLDPQSVFNAGSGIFTAPFDSYWDFSGSTQSFVVTNVEGGSVLIVTRNDASTDEYPGSFWYQNIGSAQQCNSALSSGPIFMEEGETAVFQNYASQAVTYSLSNAIFGGKLIGVPS